MPSKKYWKSRNKRSGTKDIFKKIIIFCEGTKTEPIYFEDKAREVHRRLTQETIKVVPVGTGRQHLALVRYAARNSMSGDEVRIVTDYDVSRNGNAPQVKQDFDNCISQAISKGYGIAYSNDSFELRIILHFIDFHAETDRYTYYDKLNELFLNVFGRKYDKCIIGLYDEIKSNEGNAIKRAKKLEKYQDGLDRFPSHQRIPSTTVFRLVERLNSIT